MTRTLRVFDIDQLVQIVIDLKKADPNLEDLGFSWSRESLMNELKVGCGLGLWKGNDLVAFILYRKAGEALEITLLCTRAGSQKRGAMTELFGKFCEINLDKDIWLDVHEKNHKALNLYKKIGFKQNGRRPRYYKDGSAAILMIYQH